LGLNFGKESGFEERFISALIPFFSSKPFYVKEFIFEYAHAVIGAINGLCNHEYFGATYIIRIYFSK